jgi:hypothetical protein
MRHDVLLAPSPAPNALERSRSPRGQPITYECIHATEHFVVCGSNTGAVHIYAWHRASNDAQEETSTLRPSRWVYPSQGFSDPLRAPPRVTCIRVCADPTGYMAVGLSDGAVVIVRAALQSLESFAAATDGAKVWYRHAGHAPHAVTALR